MLVLTRKIAEEVLIGENIVISIIEIRGKAVRIGIAAPRDIPVDRMEVVAREQSVNLRHSFPRHGQQLQPAGRRIRVAG